MRNDDNAIRMYESARWFQVAMFTVGFAACGYPPLPAVGNASGSDASGSDASGSDASGGDASGSDASGSDASGSDGGGTTGGCPSPYAAIAGSPHLYKTLTNVSWDQATTTCALTSASAYLAIPDDATELANLATIATVPFWVGIDDQLNQGNFVTVKGAPFPTNSPLWAPGEPNTTGGQDCITAKSATQLATDKCGTRHDAVCECEP